MRLKLLALIIALGASGAAAPALHGAASSVPGPASQDAPEQRAGGVVVKFRRSASLGALATALGDAHSDASASTAGSGLVLVTPRPGQSEDAAVASLRASGDVEFAEPNRVVTVAASPTDPLYATNQWNLPQIGLPAAWDTSTGSSGVIVAVIDTGVDATRPDLAGKITSGATAGYNFIGNNTNTTDDHYHGTFVASISAMNTNNSQGGAGVCWACKIMPVKVLDSTGSGSTFGVAQGVDWAVSHGAKVINLSLGSSTPDSTLQVAVDNAWNAGVVVVAASGNNNGPVLYPAAYASVIATGSNNQAGSRSSFSNYGPELDLMAPGESVLGALCVCAAYTGGYGIGSGTSFAAPHLAGVVALMIAAGVTDKNQIRTKLTTTATNMDAAGFDNNTGWGRVNAAPAMSTTTATATATATPTSTPTATPTVTNTPTASDTTPPAVSITLPTTNQVVSGQLNAQANASDNIAILTVKFWMDGAYQGNDPAPAYGWSWDTTQLANGGHRLLVEASDTSGNKAWSAANFVVSNGLDTTPPTANIAAPVTNQVVSGQLNASVNASDNIAVLTVKFWMDGAYQGNDPAPAYGWSWDTSQLANGGHRLLVEASDMSGNKAWSAVNFVVSNGVDTTPPTVSIAAPTANQVVSGLLNATVNASDNIAILTVKFWMDGVYQGNDPTAAYGWSWNTTLLSNGSHRILVEASDTSGNKAWYAANFTVSN